MANCSRSERNALAVDPQLSGAVKHVTDDVSILMADLFEVGILGRPEGDQAAGEVVFFEAVGVTNFIGDFFETLQRRIEFDDFHVIQGIGKKVWAAVFF